MQRVKCTWDMFVSWSLYISSPFYLPLSSTSPPPIFIFYRHWSRAPDKGNSQRHPHRNTLSFRLKPSRASKEKERKLPSAANVEPPRYRRVPANSTLEIAFSPPKTLTWIVAASDAATGPVIGVGVVLPDLFGFWRFWWPSGGHLVKIIAYLDS
ncbi:conserved hypothetical protein [Ricinus communis]|uniref:Uncharacterized protein n=1 Tax=Ricinus communis TaxID=3988 RepID=B9SZA7_RICCO|nr:conserved hypothetical protein [Ricinus communis]